MNLSPIEQAQELLRLDPLPIDARERFDALEALAEGPEVDAFADLGEALFVALNSAELARN